MKRLPFNWFDHAQHKSVPLDWFDKLTTGTLGTDRTGYPPFRFYFDERLGSATLTMETGSLQWMIFSKYCFWLAAYSPLCSAVWQSLQVDIGPEVSIAPSDLRCSEPGPWQFSQPTSFNSGVFAGEI